MSILGYKFIVLLFSVCSYMERKQICENNGSLEIDCSNAVIAISAANFGRTRPYSQICPDNGCVHCCSKLPKNVLTLMQTILKYVLITGICISVLCFQEMYQL